MKLVLGMEVGLGPGDFVLDGDPASPPQKGAEPPPQFSAHFCCGQTAGWIKMALDMELGLGPGDFVLDGDPAARSPKRGAVSPQFVLLLLVGLYSSSSSTAVCILFLEKKLNRNLSVPI